MTLNEFLKYVETGKPLKGDEIHQFMNEMSDEARRMTFELNGSYHDPEEIRELLSRLFNKPVDPSFRVFPPFYTDFGKNITVGKNVFINACCHFQDHGDFGSEQSRRQLVEIAEAFEYAHELGMATILWCYLRNNDFKKGAVDYHAAADLTGQADRLGVTIKADIVKQKLPTNNGGFKAIGFGKIDERMYTELASEHPIDLCRYQVANGYMGRVGLINSGGESHGSSDLRDAVITAVVNKRAGGMGLISGRKAFQKPMNEGVELLNTIQDVYLDSSITIA